MDIPANSVIAEGPDGLTAVLNDFLEKSKSDRLFAEDEHFILYQLGNQKSLIKVDTSQIPFRFVYNDLMGRPATIVVKEVIARFLWEKCGEKERYIHEMESRQS